MRHILIGSQLTFKSELVRFVLCYDQGHCFLKRVGVFTSVYVCSWTCGKLNKSLILYGRWNHLPF